MKPDQLTPLVFIVLFLTFAFVGVIGAAFHPFWPIRVIGAGIAVAMVLMIGVVMGHTQEDKRKKP